MHTYTLIDLSNIHQFSFHPSALFTIVGVIFSLILIYILMTQTVKTSVHRYLTLLNVAIAAWGIFETLMRLSTNAMGASFWVSYGAIGWAFAPSLLLAFCLAYVGKEKLLNNILFQVLFFLPPLAFAMISLSTDLIDSRNFSLYQRDIQSWINPVGPLFDYVVSPYIIITVLIGLWQLIRYRATVKNASKRQQTLILAIGLTLPYLLIAITEVFAPIFKVYSLSKFGVTFSSIGVGILTYGVVKYKLFVINPATVVTNVAETMHEILIVFNGIDHRIEYVNDAVRKLLGFGREDLEGEPLAKILGTNYINFHSKVIVPVEKGEEVSSVEIDLISSSGEKIPVNFSASPYRANDKSIISIVGVATDIRQLKELLNVVAEQDKLKVTVESISDGVIALDNEGKVTMVNTAASRIIAILPEEMIGKRIDDVVDIVDSKSSIINTLDLLPKGPTYGDTIICQMNDVKITYKGKESFVNLTSSSIKEGSKVHLGAIITLQDLSREHQLEEMKLDFVSMAAHELRTPLTSLRGYTYILARDYKQTFDEKETTIINRINISTQRLVGLVENLLNVTRIERGTLTTHLEPVDWCGNIKQVIDEIIDQARDKQISLIFEEPKEVYPAVYVDKMRINEVLTNLLANAITYTQPKGEVRVTLEKNDLEVITHIKDTGEGIPASAIPHLFTKFFRVSGKLEQGSKGTGLGLYISKSIIEMHKGKIWAQSEGLSKGSTFSISLPTQKPDGVIEDLSVTNP